MYGQLSTSMQQAHQLESDPKEESEIFYISGWKINSFTSTIAREHWVRVMEEQASGRIPQGDGPYLTAEQAAQGLKQKAERHMKELSRLIESFAEAKSVAVNAPAISH